MGPKFIKNYAWIHRNLKSGGLKLANGERNLEIGNWKLEHGDKELDNGVLEAGIRHGGASPEPCARVPQEGEGPIYV